MKMNKSEIKMLIDVSDPDGVWSMLKDMGYDDEADWVEENYFSWSF